MAFGPSPFLFWSGASRHDAAVDCDRENGVRVLKAIADALATAPFLLAIIVGLSVAHPSAASAEVRFGRNVRVGGHDFSNQSFNRKRRAEIYLYDRAPARSGCVWRSDGRGGKVKTCHLRRIR
jgi:hypothetical protein